MCDFIIKLINSIEWLTIIASAIIPVLIMIITLRVSKCENKKQLHQQEQEHIDIMNNQIQTTRLSVMPIFDIATIVGKKENLYGTKTNELKQIHIIEIRLKNIGNGIAMNTHLKWQHNIDTMEYFPVYEDESALYTCYKEFSYDDTVAAIGKEVKAFLIRKGKANENMSENSIILPIAFCDILENHYEQKIIIKYDISNKETGEVKTYAVIPLVPSLADEEDENENENEE